MKNQSNLKCNMMRKTTVADCSRTALFFLILPREKDVYRHSPTIHYSHALGCDFKESDLRPQIIARAK